MIPALKISAFVSYPKLFKTSGATYPGEPHRNFSGTLESATVANPKSAILIVESVVLSLFTNIKQTKKIHKNEIFRFEITVNNILFMTIS